MSFIASTDDDDGDDDGDDDDVSYIVYLKTRYLVFNKMGASSR